MINIIVSQNEPVVRSEPIDISYNIKPTQQVNIAYLSGDDMVTDTARWWLVPHWHRGTVKDWKATTFNAKIETAFEKPTFRNAWKSGRCIIPATGYYEWTGPKGNKQPWLVSVNNNEPVFFFAGMMSTNSEVNTCTILTRAASEELKDLHPRMPVILHSDQLSPWLTGAADDADIIADYGLNWGAQMKTHQVRKFGIKDDGPELIEPFGFDL